jgi:hypothetical protein
MQSRRLRFACLASLTALGISVTAQAAVVVNDSFTDGGRTNGADLLDSNWWTSSNASGIEVTTGSLGLVSGSQGRGIHTVFPTQTLGVGDKLIATYTFTTPATVGTPGSGAFRVGLFDTLGRAGLDGDIVSSSGSPSALYGWGSSIVPAPPTPTAGLPGYMMDMDVGGTSAGVEDLNFRAHDTGTVAPTGRLMGTTTGFANVSPSGPDGAYSFAPNTTYVGSISITRTTATDMEITGTLGTATHTVTDAFDSASYGMLAFWANSNTFGTNSTPSTPETPVTNNGIDFSNVTIEYIAAVPEPAAALPLLTLLLSWASRRRRA